MRVKFYQWVANRLPRPIVYYAAIRLVAYVSTRQFRYRVVPSIGAMEAIQSWERTLKERDQ